MVSDIKQAQLSEWMDIAISEAMEALAKEEVPVGAVLISDNKIIAKAHNLVEKNSLATLHAEMQVIKKATEVLGNWRLSDSVLVSTLEPCPMCAGAIRLSRIPVVVFGAFDKRMGAMHSHWDLSQDSNLGPPTTVYSGVKEDQCKKIIVDFFKQRRK